jgi:hypothetical protein
MKNLLAGWGLWIGFLAVFEIFLKGVIGLFSKEGLMALFIAGVVGPIGFVCLCFLVGLIAWPIKLFFSWLIRLFSGH